ncbi:hypothetical protein OpiT1DRAFT_03631 [Opitutaceae bacterium TAV1]|nr:hypothetical protein OpiT1DRAFT_03631 [Opitutaceae bacterium TAV1]
MEYKYLQKIESGRWPGLQLRTIEHLAGILKVEAWQLIAPPSGLHLKLEQPAPDQRIKPKPGRPRKIQVE